MSRTLWRRAATGLGALVAAAAVPLVVTTPAAHAEVEHCVTYLVHQGYVVGEQSLAACNAASDGSAIGRQSCYLTLTGLGVGYEHADTACDVASD
ncbi:hypothetical protein [Saccharopolyspora hordei]|uniref:Secreted protein n=1 Tax=Saccharopolyspora hordei TaxID=1838 RepID=A0A853ALM9_9PSEU|nr:hypothetical protein [Saccharopolyspora hordei]NYI85662.1 hypothetical protein [Saccharopolyspora hordei]